MPYPLNYEMLPNHGDAITLQPAENQTFNKDGSLTGVTPWRWMLGVSNVTNTTVKNYNNRMVQIVNDFTLGDLSCTMTNAKADFDLSKPNGGPLPTNVIFKRTITNNTSRNLTFNEVWLALTVRPGMYPSVISAACIVKEHLNSPITVRPSKSATIEIKLINGQTYYTTL